MDEQENKNSRAKINRDVSLLKTLLQRKVDFRNVEKIPPALLNELLSKFVSEPKMEMTRLWAHTTARDAVPGFERHLKQKSYQASIIKDHSRFANPRLSHFLWKCSYLIIVSICKCAMPFMNWILKIWIIFVSLLKVKCLCWQISVKTSN